MTEKIKKLPKMFSNGGPQIHPKSAKIRSAIFWGPHECIRAPLDHQNCVHGAPKGSKMDVQWALCKMGPWNLDSSYSHQCLLQHLSCLTWRCQQNLHATPSGAPVGPQNTCHIPAFIGPKNGVPNEVGLRHATIFWVLFFSST